MKINFSWVLIIVLAELILLHTVYSLVYSYSDIKSVVDAFAFGGTLVGILVGVIAIIYAFYQGAAQQQTNTTMVSELTKLATIKEDIGASANSLRKEMGGLTLIAEKLALIESNVINTHDGLTELSNRIDKSGSFIVPVSHNSNATSVPPEVMGVDSVISFLKVYLPKQAILYLCFFSYFLKARGIKKFDDHINSVFSVMKDFDDGYKSSIFTENLIYVVFQCLSSVFGSLGIVCFTLDPEDSEIISWEISDEFKDKIDIIFEILWGSADSDANKTLVTKIYKM
ncbi:hypothetical protein [Janthinobacterium sp. SUN033]|uniref:hypothetical protein n=1 Tax=Janthinobacterium sp. SUN033 TaxID=3002439 RepID=UPI0025AFEC1F|nr:hypothetical protein [Janthinobacterium sp. SUN033]MDN2677733.1 hypothetical protein [Janthinobacterium sp. SUN033]